MNDGSIEDNVKYEKGKGEDMGKLAIHGGLPTREKFLAYGRQSIDESDVQAVSEVLMSDYLTTGPKVDEFEHAITDYVGANYAVAVSNGTAALHMAAFAAQIKEGDEVLVPSMTFAASANCVLYCGGIPVFVDIDPDTYTIDLKDLESKITDKTKAIIPVDYTGQSVRIDEIMGLARKHNLIVIEDGAHSLGSEYKGEKVGNRAHMTMFSFHPVKPVTTAEGGAIVTNDENLYNKMMMFRSHGITRDERFLLRSEGPWYYEQQLLGYNYRLTDVQGALGISQMKKLDRFVNRRREIVHLYNEQLKELEEINTPYEMPESNSGWHLYVIRLNLNKLQVGRKEIFEALLAENIGVNVHYIPIHYHPYYEQLGYKKGITPEAEKLYNEMITLPLHPNMSDSDARDVVKALRKVITYYRKKSL